MPDRTELVVGGVLAVGGGVGLPLSHEVYKQGFRGTHRSDIASHIRTLDAALAGEDPVTQDDLKELSEFMTTLKADYNIALPFDDDLSGKLEIMNKMYDPENEAHQKLVATELATARDSLGARVAQEPLRVEC